MFDRREIRAAAEEGILTAEQARAFENFVQQRSDPDRGLGSENLRFLTNFNEYNSKTRVLTNWHMFILANFCIF